MRKEINSCPACNSNKFQPNFEQFGSARYLYCRDCGYQFDNATPEELEFEEKLREETWLENIKNDRAKKFRKLWREINESIPKTGEHIIAYSQKEGVCLVEWRLNNCTFSFHEFCMVGTNGEIMVTDITHWILPEPPQGILTE
jgi:hypothetical protein